MSNYRRATTSGASYFFTVVTFRRQKFLTDDDCRVWLREAIVKTRVRYPFNIDAWVLLPDHLHCIWTLPESDADFSVRWNGIKKRFTTQAKHRLHKPEWVNASKQKHRESTIWQRRFWEHQIRDDRDYQQHWIIFITILLSMVWLKGCKIGRIQVFIVLLHRDCI